MLLRRLLKTRTEPETAAVGANGWIHRVELRDREAGVVEEVLARYACFDVVVERAVLRRAVLMVGQNQLEAQDGWSRLTLMGTEVAVGIAAEGMSTHTAQ